MALGNLAQVDEIILQQCDVELYLETMQYGVSYGKSLKLMGFPKSLLLMIQQRLATALIANEKLEECRQFLTEEWTGKKHGRLYKRIIINLNFVEACCHLDTDKFNHLLKKLTLYLKRINYLLQSRCSWNKSIRKQQIFYRYIKRKILTMKYNVSICWANVLIKPRISKWQKNVCVIYLHMELQCHVKSKRRNGS